jgi:DNA polymerase (family X)
VTNLEISKLLNNVAAAYSIKDEKKYRFQIIAYENAAEAIEHNPTEIKELYKEGKLEDVQGIGATLKSRLEELITTGKCAHFEEVLKDIPPAMFPLLDIPSFGPKKAYRLVSEFKLQDPETVIQEIAEIAKAGKIAELAGFGEKSQADILRAIEEYGRGKTKTARMVLPYATELARKMIAYLERSDAVVQASTLGSLRRRRETIGDIDIAVATNDPKAVLDHFTAYPHKERIIERGERTSSIIVSSGKQIDLMVESPKGFGALLQHFTGSKAHNVHLREYALSKGLSLSDYGIRERGSDGEYTLFDSEEEFYKYIGLQWVPPEIREDTGEIELALKNNLPKLLELSDMKGDFHLHSSYPIEPSHDMGVNSMEEMLQKAKKLGYKYLGFSEHNPSISKHTAKQVYDILLKRKEFIENLDGKHKKDIRVFSLLETDILPNGKLAVEDDALQLLDGSIISVHSAFDMDIDRMTERVLKGLSNPKAKILAHPTGRLLNQRPSYELHWDQIFDFCVKNNKALEINASPLRLDLPDVLVRKAIDKGVKLFIDTDSHALDQMDLMEFGVTVARRGWATADDILNALPYNELSNWFKK